MGDEDRAAKPIAQVSCTADFRGDRCPAMIQDNDHATVVAACLRCEHARVTHYIRGQVVAEIGHKATDETKEYRTDARGEKQ